MTREDRTRRADERRPGPAPEWESPREARAREALINARPRGVVKRRGSRPHPVPILLGIIVLVAAAAGIAAMAPRGSSPAAAVWSVVATSTAPAASDPTPAFASFRDVRLLMPVPAAAATVIAFHQSSFSDSYAMKPLVAIRSTADAKAAADAERAGGPPVKVSGATSDADGVWTGTAVEVWRSNVNGKMDSALDCGAPPGTPVFAPLSGTVMRVRAYKLYGRYSDFEIQVRPDAFNDVDLFILHVTGPQVAEGAHVIAGVTQIASVRNLASKISGLQLRSYTTEGGNHTHVQLNKVPHPNETWPVGQDPPGFKRHGT